MRPNSVYIIKGKICGNVISCKNATFHNAPVLSITFANKGEYVTRSYNHNDVDILEYVKTYTGDFRYCDENKKYVLVHVVHEYSRKRVVVYGLEHNNGYTKYQYKNDCLLESSIRDKKGKVLTYLESLSRLSTIGLGEEGGQISLADKYAAAKFIFKGSLLAKYLEPSKAKLEYHPQPNFMVFPFGCNEDQFAAVKNALTSDISVIQGPPGTGKTQTILNVVANLILQEKTVEIVSNNNSAVQNINDKLTSYGYDFLVAFLGKTENKERFFDSQTGLYPQMHKWECSGKRMAEIKNTLKTISAELPAYFQNIQRVASLKEDIAQYEKQNEQNQIKSQKLPRCKSSKLYSLLLAIEDNLTRKGSISIVNRLKSWRYGFGYKTVNREALASVAHQLKHRENQVELRRLVDMCNKVEGLYKDYISLSKEYFEAYLYERFGKSSLRQKFQQSDLMLFNVQDFQKEYPIILSTTFSATTNINQVVPFDMIIMDEASQVDIAAGALSLNCANTAVIVGDDKQLPNVVTDIVRAQADALYTKYEMTPEYRYYGNSFLSSVQKVFSEAPVILLREHYRCEPRIIGFCNQRFYRGLLIPMTKRSEQPSLSVIRTVKGNHAVGTANMRQAEESVKEVERLKQHYNSIGVIVPYNEQARLIGNLLKDKGMEEIPVSTVHKFQGREEDAIVLCTVDNTIREFVDDPHLLNVAVSRAKKHFSIIINGNEMVDSNIRALVEYIENCEGVVREGVIRSVFDILYKQYKEERMHFVAKHTNISQYISENIMMEVLNSIVSMQEWQHLDVLFQYPLAQLFDEDRVQLTEEESVYANNSWTLLDFLLYDATTKRAVLAIEVDGISFHREGSRQWERDQLKNSVLEKIGLPLLRLSTRGSNEKERIIEVLEKISAIQ